MKRLLILTGTLPLIIAPALPANASIHELVAAFCSGGGVGVIDTNGFLEPPGVDTPGMPSFRQPAQSTGVVVNGMIADIPAAKYPAGTPVGTLNATGSSLSDHPSAEHCAAMNPP
jgi:hypothetical protein